MTVPLSVKDNFQMGRGIGWIVSRPKYRPWQGLNFNKYKQLITGTAYRFCSFMIRKKFAFVLVEMARDEATDKNGVGKKV